MKKYLISWCGFVCVLLLAGCASKAQLVPFRYSSLNYSEGKPITGKLVDVSVDEARKRLIVLAKRKGLDVVGEREFTMQDYGMDGLLCMFVYKGDDGSSGYGRSALGSQDSRMSSDNIEYSSKFYFELISEGAGTLVRAMGVPILNRRMSCPEYVQQNYENCHTESLSTIGGKELSATVRTQWGYDVSGKIEEETVRDLLRELENYLEQ